MINRILKDRIRKITLLIFVRGVKLLSGHGISKFYPLKIAYEFLISHLIPLLKKPNAAVEVQGHRMFLDSKDSLGLFPFGVYEPFRTEIIKQQIQKGNVVLDIGANIGYFTLIFAQLVGERGKVFAFEPEPDNFALLQKNMEANGYQNVILVKKAVSNKARKVKLYLSEDNKGDHRIYDSHDGRKFVEVEVITLDEYFKDYDLKVDFIKMDIQGAEGGALEGCSLLIERNRNVKIITEFWPIGLKRFGTKPEEFLMLLTKRGFELYDVSEQEHRFEPVDVTTLLEKYTPEKGNHTDILCVREE
ncbi:hypothetical protein ES706_06310 [subsurface metagenome]